ncbi:unnamed protein product [Paramecium sonneborni]|uniref:Uncharacterized protein n=1 Tax=Paramecium sonneborni TaxID=65129 RepID=A0A8S1LNX3_9CILI|nr:unnamed protein product [Paramecium sonneborni]
MSGLQIIYGEIKGSKQIVQFRIDPTILNKQINPNIIKDFLKEVELDEQYYDKPSILFQAGEQYFNSIGKNQIYDLENAQKWINSNNLIEMTYALKWIYQVASVEEKALLTYDLNINQEILKKIIILNIALEQKIQISINSLINLLDQNCEILYCIAQYLQSAIKSLQFEELLPLLIQIINLIDGQIYNKFIVLQLMDIVHSQFSQFNIPKLKINQFQIQNWENCTEFTIQEQELPFLILRRSREVYNLTQSQYESFQNCFFFKWQTMDMLIDEQIKNNKTKIEKQIENNENNENNENKIDKEIEIQIPKKQRQKQRLVFSVQVRPNQNQSNPIKENQNGAPRPPPAPINLINTSSYTQYNKLPMLQQNLIGTIWSVSLPQNPLINPDNLKYFLKKQVIKKEANQQKETVIYSESVLKEQGIKLELLLNKLSKINLIEIMDQINQLEFVENNNNNEMKSVLELLYKIILLIPEDFQNKYEKKINEIMQNNQQNSNNYFINRNDQSVKQIYDLNFKKSIEIEFFFKEHVENYEFIVNQILQFIKIFEDIKKDQELILYFHYIKEYGKIFNNIKIAEYGYKFENLIEFSYKTQQLVPQQEELIKFIVEDMINQNIKFQDLNDPYYQSLQILSKESNALSENKKTIETYKKHNLWLENHLRNFENNQAEINFFNKAKKYFQLYKDFIYSMETIYQKGLKNYEEIRKYFCDFRNELETPQFFGDILKIKKQLMEQYQYILFQRKKQQQKQYSKLHLKK